ncbi:MAG: hypothetical protein VX237_09720 [Chloroflexota bacterium]|nr:hypothetical protein [Chloroflexota bacterium]
MTPAEILILTVGLVLWSAMSIRAFNTYRNIKKWVALSHNPLYARIFSRKK